MTQHHIPEDFNAQPQPQTSQDIFYTCYVSSIQQMQHTLQLYCISYLSIHLYPFPDLNV